MIKSIKNFINSEEELTTKDKVALGLIVILIVVVEIYKYIF